VVEIIAAMNIIKTKPSSKLRCIKCLHELDEEPSAYFCPKCGSLLEVVIDIEKVSIKKSGLKKREFRLWRYREFLPIEDEKNIITLNEGGTPLLKAQNLAGLLGIEADRLYLKHEGLNPTGSFKDRGMTVGMTRAREFGVKAVACASTGNTSASLSAYAAKANIPCIVLLPTGKIALGKLSQALLHGAKVMGIEGNFDTALEMIKKLCAELGIYLLNSINPWRLEGQKTLAFEICEQLDWQAPDVVVVPVGNCGNISAIWKGMKEFYEHGFIKNLPRMIGIQAEGASPVVHAFRNSLEDVIPIKEPETIATAIRIGAPKSALKALRSVKESKGYLESVSDEEIINAQKLIARKEGVGTEPASASAVAGLKKLLGEGIIKKDETIACVLTGNALKDPDIIIKHSEGIETCKDIESLKKVVSAILV